VPDEKLKSDIKLAYLSIGKGVQETQALMKAFIAKPTMTALEKTFGSASGPRSIGAGVTMWKQMVVKKKPELAGKLGADPDHLLSHIQTSRSASRSTTGRRSSSVRSRAGSERDQGRQGLPRPECRTGPPWPRR
jgi:hypothetical protein